MRWKNSVLNFDKPLKHTFCKKKKKLLNRLFSQLSVTTSEMIYDFSNQSMHVTHVLFILSNRSSYMI